MKSPRFLLPIASAVLLSPSAYAQDTLMFHGNREHHGWNNAETALTPTNVRSGEEQTVVLKCQGNGVTSFDLSDIQLRIHDLG